MKVQLEYGSFGEDARRKPGSMAEVCKCASDQTTGFLEQCPVNR